MITPKQRAYLRKLAQTTECLFQVGKSGITSKQIEQLNNALEARELIKINLLNTMPEDKETTANEITKQTKSEMVQVIGNKLTLYKRSEKKPKIELP